jgi:HPt (histidine-containing phosphotransfer) domain-containing protein
LEKAAALQQAESIGYEAHILKGSSGYFGAHRVQNLCLQIESLVKSNQLAGVARYVTELQGEFLRVSATLQMEASHGPA